MNCNVYIFGRLSSGYTQYPENTSSEMLKSLYPLCKATTQLAIHRNANMMYYCYIRKLNGNKYLGLCVTVNGYYIKQINELFSLFENAIEKMAQYGSFIHFAKDGTLTTSTTSLKQDEEEIDTLSENLKCGFEAFGSPENRLPQIDYTVAKDSVKEFNILDDKQNIIRASYTYGFTFVYKDEDFNTVRINSYRGVLSRLNDENSELRLKNNELKKEYAELQLKQRNTQWVGILSVIVAILGGILYFKVINPSEVTKYQTKDFIYYGPLKDKKPHGIGVAFYPQDDVDGRKFYIGNFENGVRQDSTAMLYYREGDYFYGKMKDDKWENGLLYKCSDGTYFRGSFHENIPYNGVWYDHVKRYKSVKGEIVY